jgi:putative addiction module component (TIGR02574 family)
MSVDLVAFGVEKLAVEYRIDLVDALWNNLHHPSPELIIDIPPAGASFKIGHLSVDERIQLAQDIWGTIPQDYVFPISDALKAELDRRMNEFDQNSEIGIPWEEVKASLSKKYGLKTDAEVD